MRCKKLAICLFFVVLIVISGCGKNEVTKPKLDFDYTFQAKITSEDKTYEIDGKNIANQWEFVYHSPAEIDGLTVNFTEKTATISFQELENSWDRNDISQSNLCNIIASCLDFLRNSEKISYSKKDGIIVGKGVFQGGDFVVKYDKNNFPEEISIGDNFKISILDFKKQ